MAAWRSAPAKASGRGHFFGASSEPLAPILSVKIPGSWAPWLQFRGPFFFFWRNTGVPTKIPKEVPSSSSVPKLPALTACRIRLKIFPPHKFGKWMWLKIKQLGQSAGFGPGFHLPGQPILGTKI